MATAEELQTKIDAIDELLQSGMTSTDNDGLKATIDHGELRKTRAELKRELEALSSTEDDTGGPFRRIQL